MNLLLSVFPVNRINYHGTFPRIAFYFVEDFGTYITEICIKHFCNLEFFCDNFLNFIY